MSHSGFVIVIDGGPAHVELTLMPSSRAATSVNGLNELPAWRCASIA